MTVRLPVLVILALLGSASWVTAQSIGAVNATPQAVPANSPTAVLFTVAIADAAVIPTSVNLLRVDSSGRTLATLGTMHDDGVNGDSARGDTLYSLRVSVNEPLTARALYRVSAAFRGRIARVQSAVVTLTVLDVALPADPGLPGSSTLGGVDADQDDVRDDIQRYIVLNYFDSPRTQAALGQVARSLQSALLSSADRTTSLNNGTAFTRAIECMYYVRPTTAKAVKDALIAQFLNTRARSDAFNLFDRQLEGAVFPGTPAGSRRQACSFDPDALPR